MVNLSEASPQPALAQNVNERTDNMTEQTNSTDDSYRIRCAKILWQLRHPLLDRYASPLGYMYHLIGATLELFSFQTLRLSVNRSNLSQPAQAGVGQIKGSLSTSILVASPF